MNRFSVADTPPRLPSVDCRLSYPDSIDCFQVEEIPLYLPGGDGEHLYLHVEKRGIDTPELVSRVAELLGVDPRDVGWAGRKDKHAVARQWISVPRKQAEPRLGSLGDADYGVLDAIPHGNKLRLGHLKGNCFTLLLKGDYQPSQLEGHLTDLSRQGIPNYYGFQRFGRNGDNHIRGERALQRGGRKGGRKARFLLSAYQAYLFNAVVAGRLTGLGSLLPGDLAWIHAKGAVFQVDDPEAESPRAAALEISPSGPMPGKKMSLPSGAAGRLEEELLASAGWDPAWAAAMRGGRRPLRVPVDNLTWREVSGGLELKFDLPSGSYASVLLGELGVGMVNDTSGER